MRLPCHLNKELVARESSPGDSMKHPLLPFPSSASGWPAPPPLVLVKSFAENNPMSHYLHTVYRVSVL